MVVAGITPILIEHVKPIRLSIMVRVGDVGKLTTLDDPNFTLLARQ